MFTMFPLPKLWPVHQRDGSVIVLSSVGHLDVLRYSSFHCVPKAQDLTATLKSFHLSILSSTFESQLCVASSQSPTCCIKYCHLHRLSSYQRTSERLTDHCPRTTASAIPLCYPTLLLPRNVPLLSWLCVFVGCLLLFCRCCFVVCIGPRFRLSVVCISIDSLCYFFGTVAALSSASPYVTCACSAVCCIGRLLRTRCVVSGRVWSVTKKSHCMPFRARIL